MLKYIFLAHSDVEMRNFFYEVFSNLGYKITTLPTYKEVLEALKKERPHYIILDPFILDKSTDTAPAEIKSIDENIKVIVLPVEKNVPQQIHNVLETIIKEGVSEEIQEKTRKLQFQMRILVVDDEKESAEMVKNYLSRRGYSVDIALNGEEALLNIKANKPDVVLLDIRMPGMDGLLVLRNIKDIDKTINIIMTSAIEDEEAVTQALKIGAKGYLTKPFNLKKLETTILSAVLKKYLENERTS